MENKELKDRFIDEKTGIEYIRNGDYYLPNLVIEPQRKIDLNKYGRLRLEYLKKYKKAEYTILFIDNKLIDHLEGVQETATKRVEEIIKSLKEQKYDMIFCSKSEKEKKQQNMFFFWYKREFREQIMTLLRRIHRADLIPKLYGKEREK